MDPVAAVLLGVAAGSVVVLAAQLVVHLADRACHRALVRDLWDWRRNALLGCDDK